MAKLHNGQILAISGPDGLGSLTLMTELYDAATGAWTQTGSVNDPRMAFHDPAVLQDGRVLIAGGHDNKVNDYASAELYDPSTGQWTRTGSLNTSRRYAVTVGLLDGRVLVATGAHGVPDGNRFLSSAEIYDPATGQWTFTGSAATRRESATAIRLQDGRVMVIGGYTCCDFFTPATDLYNPATGTWSQAGNRPHGGGGMALVVLPNGQVLTAGGSNPSAGAGTSADSALFNPATGQWTATGPLHHARSGADAVLLPNGKVLLAGGGPLQSEIYDPATGTWTIEDLPLNVQHGGANMELLTNGAVLIAGGYTDTGPTTTTELYTTAPASPIQADFVATPQNSGRSISFDGSNSVFPPGATPAYLWDFDNDGTVDQTTDVPTTVHEYPDTQPRLATLTVVDGLGGSDSITKPVAVPVDTVLVLLAGMWPSGTGEPQPAYRQVAAEGAFRDLLAGLKCAELTAPGGITKLCNGGNRARLFWSPYSYRGPNGQTAPHPYGGADTHQVLSASATHLNDQIGQILIKHPGANLVLVGYSTGGTVATRWAGDHNRTDVPVITLDSPAYGFWPEDPETASVPEDKENYCGLRRPWNTIATPFADEFAFRGVCTLWEVPIGGYRSTVSYDWRGERTFSQNSGLTNVASLHLYSATNSTDFISPPWWNTSPLADGNKIIDCTDLQVGHTCVLHNDSALSSVRRVVQATTEAAKNRRVPTVNATSEAWESNVGPERFGAFITTIRTSSSNGRIIAVGEWGPATPASDGIRHGDTAEAGTLTCAIRPSSPAQAVHVVSADWRSRSYVVFWQANTSRPVRASQVRVLPYADTRQFEATIQDPDPRLIGLTNPCPPGGSS
ncbi:PKD domain-containing protein [Rhizocola hellebori]|uniref:PKD domain-containing protein n=1 Tax=Rhizocola hellebori TaxID=1392758 RepID=UPI00194311CB|nr:PKD domain-containing protein [Rhizocola hellebori]